MGAHTNSRPCLNKKKNSKSYFFLYADLFTQFDVTTIGIHTPVDDDTGTYEWRANLISKADDRVAVRLQCTKGEAHSRPRRRRRRAGGVGDTGQIGITLTDAEGAGLDLNLDPNVDFVSD